MWPPLTSVTRNCNWTAGSRLGSLWRTANCGSQLPVHLWPRPPHTLTINQIDGWVISSGSAAEPCVEDSKLCGCQAKRSGILLGTLVVRGLLVGFTVQMDLLTLQHRNSSFFMDDLAEQSTIGLSTLLSHIQFGRGI